MGIFDKWKNSNNVSSGVSRKTAASSSPYFEALSKCIGVAQLRQVAFGKIIRDASRWDADMQKGEITFDNQKFSVLLLGSESQSTHTWMWGWKNINNYPDFLWEPTQLIYEKLVSEGMREIEGEKIRLSKLVTGHAIAALAVTSSVDRFCYYRAPYSSGAAFLLIKSPPEWVFTEATALDASSCISAVISNFSISHKLLVKGIFEEYCYKIEEQDATISGCFHDESSLTVSFDKKGRILNLKTN